MSLVYTPELEEIFSGCNILIDACVIIESAKNEELDQFLEKIRGLGCTFFSLPSVKDEYTCGARNMVEYKKLSDYFEGKGILLLSRYEEKMSTVDGIKFNIALRLSDASKPSYVDRSLLFIPYLYKDTPEKPYIMTLNYKDVPRNFYDLVGFIAYDEKGFRNIGIYEFNEEKYNKIIRGL